MKNTKIFSKRRSRVMTQLEDTSFVDVKALKKLENSLAEGSKRRLREYRSNLSTSRGVERPNYDSKVEELIKRYALHPKKVNQQIHYLKNLKDPKGFLFSRNLKIYRMITDDMKRFSQPDYTSFRWNENYQAALEEMKKEFSKLCLKPLTYRCDADIEEAVPRKDTHSGFTWINSGEKYKGENMEQIYRRYCEEESKALESGTFAKPILIGFRTQGSGEYDDQGRRTFTCKHKLRVVSMIDLMQIIAELKFAKPIQNYLADVMYYAGGKDPIEIGRIISGFKAKYKNYVTLDYSSYDQTISSWLIEDAFDVIKCAFKDMSPEDEKLFGVIVNDFIHKDFIVTEGIVHSNKGVPSGSMFTQIIDTVVNHLMILTYFISINAECEMIIMGDDNSIFSNSEIDVPMLASYISKNFGITVNEDKSVSGLSLKDPVEFLSCVWKDEGRWRTPEILLSKLLFSERYRKYSEDVGPEHVIFASILMYDLGMAKLIDVRRFCADYPISRQYVMDKVGSEYLPGALVYIRDYTLKRKKQKVRYVA